MPERSQHEWPCACGMRHVPTCVLYPDHDCERDGCSDTKVRLFHHGPTDEDREAVRRVLTDQAVNVGVDNLARIRADAVFWLGQLFPQDVSGAADSFFDYVLASLRALPVEDRMAAMGMECRCCLFCGVEYDDLINPPCDDGDHCWTYVEAERG